jgi:hypothetical protein
MSAVDLVVRHLRAEDTGDLEGAMAPVAAGCWYAIPAMGVSLRGRDAVAAHHAAMFQTFPDLKNADVRYYAADDRVFARIRVERTQTGRWGPFDPTGARLVTEALAEFPLSADGLLAAEIVHLNPLNALHQMGVVPSANAFELADAYRRLQERA